MIDSASGLLRIRLASLLIKLGTSPAVCDGFRVCIESGRLDNVLGLASLAGGGEVDLLELLSAYEMLSELGSCGAGWGYLASTGALDRLLSLSVAEPDSIESMLKPGALQFFATTIEAVRSRRLCCRFAPDESFRIQFVIDHGLASGGEAIPPPFLPCCFSPRA